jgi:acyl carrier protein
MPELTGDIAMTTRTVRDRLQPIWCEVLDVPTAEDEADFFELGGESVTAIHLAARVENDFRTACTIEDIFDNPTFGELTGFVSEKP